MIQVRRMLPKPKRDYGKPACNHRSCRLDDKFCGCKICSINGEVTLACGMHGGRRRR